MSFFLFSTFPHLFDRKRKFALRTEICFTMNHTHRHMHTLTGACTHARAHTTACTDPATLCFDLTFFLQGIDKVSYETVTLFLSPCQSWYFDFMSAIYNYNSSQAS